MGAKKFPEIFISQGSHFFIVLDSRADAEQISVTVTLSIRLTLGQYLESTGPPMGFTPGPWVRSLPIVI